MKLNGAIEPDYGSIPRSYRDDLESVTLVDAENKVVGSCGKLAAHRDGKLHRAFSILITNPHEELLLQRRAACKYHFASRWSNACCGHPRPGESTPGAARRRLMEEFGFTVSLTQVAELSYYAEDEASGLVEHEYLHVFHGQYAGEPCPNPNEIGAWRWMLPDRVRRGLAARPDWFTPWFTLLAAKHADDLNYDGINSKAASTETTVRNGSLIAAGNTAVAEGGWGR
jgi:isopentenyl-diphosphate delta-isomerase